MNPRVTRPLLAALGCATAFTLLLFAVHDVNSVMRWDATALDGLRSLSENHRWIWVSNDAIIHTVDAFGFATILTAICAVGLYLRRYRQVAAAVVLVIAANLISQVIKAMASHPRFHGVLGDNQLTAAGFPSGHTTAAMSLALASVLVAPSRWRRLVAIGGGAFALSVSIALTIQGWHYPSDVIGGLLVASGVSMLVVAGLRIEELRRTDRVRARRRGLSIERRTVEIAAAGGGAALAVLAVSHLSQVTSFAASHTSAVAAALAIAASLAVLVFSVTAELEAG
jgi:membrane-associated phospholipid phosphatase